MEQGLKNVAQRIVNAENNFKEIVQGITGCTVEQADSVLRKYIRAKFVKLDAVGGRYSVKHGSSLDKDVLLHVINS